jgi:hypothetical protein
MLDGEAEKDSSLQTGGIHDCPLFGYRVCAVSCFWNRIIRVKSVEWVEGGTVTLIMTAVTKTDIVQVSDRRLSVGNRPVDDQANKAICVVCRDGEFAIAYTGLADTGAGRTDIWLIDYLAYIDAGNLEVGPIVSALEREAAAWVSNVCFEARGLTIALAGVRYGFGPFIACVTNQEDKNANLLAPPPLHNFGSRWFLPKPGFERDKVDLWIHGAEAAVQGEVETAIKKMRKRLFTASSAGVAEALVKLIRRASTHPRYGRVIGRNCMVVSLPLAGGNFQATYYPEAASGQSFMPHLITAGQAFKDVRIWSGDGPPPW